MGFRTLEKMKTCLDILLVSGYRPVPRRQMYWSLDDDVRNNAISKAMKRDLFNKLMKYLHLSNNSKLDKKDKLLKAHPSMSSINEKIYFCMLTSSSRLLRALMSQLCIIMTDIEQSNSLEGN